MVVEELIIWVCGEDFDFLVRIDFLETLLYNILDPYRMSNKYYNGHYVCLWQVTEREIVSH